jgi:hypothetical protein
MAKQINFWMTSKDEEQFIALLKKEFVCWAYYELPFESIPVLYDLKHWKYKEESQRIVVIKEKDKQLLQYKHIRKLDVENTTLINDNFEPWTMVGVNASPSFEWKTCSYKNGIIGRGRIYLSTNWYDEEKQLLQEKEVSLIKWFDKIVNKLREMGEKHSYKGMYVMPHANLLLKEKEVVLDMNL